MPLPPARNLQARTLLVDVHVDAVVDAAAADVAASRPLPVHSLPRLLKASFLICPRKE